MGPGSEFSDIVCPECGHHPTRSRRCSNIKCEDGRVDLFREDPIVHPYGPRKKYRTCRTCRGNGHLHWCPECGEDLHGRDDLESAREPMRR